MNNNCLPVVSDEDDDDGEGIAIDSKNKNIHSTWRKSPRATIKQFLLLTIDAIVIGCEGAPLRLGFVFQRGEILY